jgi:hypothetical protein
VQVDHLFDERAHSVVGCTWDNWRIGHYRTQTLELVRRCSCGNQYEPASLIFTIPSGEKSQRDLAPARDPRGGVDPHMHRHRLDTSTLARSAAEP